MASPGNQHCADCIGTLAFSVKHKCKQPSSRKTVPQKTGHQSLKNKNSKNAIHNTLKVKQKYSTVILQNVVSYGGIAY